MPLFMMPDSFQRIERQLAGLTDAINKLVLIEERQKQDWKRMDAFDQRMNALTEKADSTDRKLDQWINRGIGAWALAATLLALVKYLPLT